MQHTLQVRVFDWRGRWHYTVERVYPTPGSKVARRQRLLSATAETGHEMDEYAAVRLAIAALQRVADQLE